MFIKLLKYFWSLRHQFIKYFIIGITGVFLDVGSLILLKEKFGWTPTLAVVVNQIFILVFNFSLNKYWSFREKSLPHKQIVRYLILAGLNYVFSITVMYIFNHVLGWDYRLIRLATIAVMVSWNFFLYKYWVYHESGK